MTVGDLRKLVKDPAIKDDQWCMILMGVNDTNTGNKFHNTYPIWKTSLVKKKGAPHDYILTFRTPDVEYAIDKEEGR